MTENELACLKAMKEGIAIRIANLEAKIKQLEFENKKLALKARLAYRLPFCSDHRDKVAGKPCRECEIEKLEGTIARLRRPQDWR